MVETNSEVKQRRSYSPGAISTNEKELAIICKLKQVYNPWSDFVNDWIKVYHIRKHDYQSKDYGDLIHKWPVLNDAEKVNTLVCISGDLEQHSLYYYWFLGLLGL